MTHDEQCHQNRINARKSSGPKTPEGKLASRGNALKHGFFAVVVPLPNESPEEIQGHVDSWVEACRPQGEAESALVGRLAVSSIRLKRMADAEAEVLAEQVREAHGAWDAAQKLKLLELTRLIRTDPAAAVIGLEGFGPGLGWMIGRWGEIKTAIDTAGFWTNLDLFWEAARLRGLDASGLKDAPHDVFDFFFTAVWCVPDWPNGEGLGAFLKDHTPPCWEGRYGEGASSDPALAVELVRTWIGLEIERLEGLAAARAAIEEASRAGAPRRAAAPADTPANKQLYQYIQKTESSFDRALRALTGLQKDRAKAAEKAAEPARKNEADPTRPSNVKALHPGSYVRLMGKTFYVDEAVGGQIILSPVDPCPRPAAGDPERPPTVAA